ncbi:hypothetical protein JCM10450v2_001965 [Rhodotorula kratochvilovae]
MAATPPTATLAVLDDSLNFIAASPALVIHDSPCGRSASPSPTKRLRGKGRTLQEDSLGPKDVNGGEGLLVDFGQDHGFSPAASSTLHPHTPSAFARSLLDKSPSLLKAQLSTPLIPLGTPITTRKKASTSPSKENVTPSARRNARQYHNSPSPLETPSAPPAPSPAPALTVRFSPSPRRTRSSPRKKAVASSPAPSTPAPLPSFHTAATPSFRTAARPSSPLTTPLHRVGLATPSAGTAHPLASPFPHFSPSTPAIRTHSSYDTDELTDADADGSIWEDEPSMSYPAAVEADEQVDEVADAIAGLALVEPVEEPLVDARDDSADETEREEDGESSGGEFTETEVATSEDEADEPLAADSLNVKPVQSVKLIEAAEHVVHVVQKEQNEQVEQVEHVEQAKASLPTAEAPEEELPPVEEHLRDEEELAHAEAPAETPVEQELLAPSRSAEPGEGPAVVDADDEPPVHPVADVINDEAEAPAAVVAANEPAERSRAPLPTEPLDADVPQSLRDNALDTPVMHEVEQAFAVQHFDEVEDETVANSSADEDVATSEAAAEGALEANVGPASLPLRVPDIEVAPSAEAAAAPPPSELQLELAGELQVLPPSPERAALPVNHPATPVSTPSLTFSTPPPASANIRSTPPRATTPSTLKPTQPSVSAAPTARRQLTKLTSLAATRFVPASVSGNKPVLTALVPGSAAASRRLAAPSRLAVPTKRTLAGSVIAEASPAPQRALVTPPAKEPSEPVEPTRPASALSSSSASTASTSSNPPASSVARPRTLVRSGLKPPGTVATSSGLARPTLSSSARTAPAPAPAPTKLTAASTSRLTRPLTVPRAAPAASAPSASRFARSETAATSRTGASSSRPTPSLSATASAPSLMASKAAALRQVTAAPPAPLQPAVPSPSKRRPARVTDGKLEVPTPQAAPSPALHLVSPAPTVELPARAETPTLVHPAAPAAAPAFARSPFPAHPLSPPRIAASRPPASPLRSPRRVPINSQAAGPVPPPPAASSALVAPADKLVAAAPPALFEPVVRSAAPRAVRARRTRATEAELLAAAAPAALAPAAVAASSMRTTRRTAAASAPHAPVPVPAPIAPIVRSARRPARREPSAEEVPVQPTPADEASSASSASSDVASAGEPAARVRPAPHFHAAPSVTQEELNRLTQRNTKKNQQAFNKLKLETVYIDADRPPSPTSKIRRSFGAGAGGDAPEVVRAATKAGREARAAKRRNALRASADGSELAALAAELQAEKENELDIAAPAAPREHFRAAGDDEQYHTPARAPALKSKAGAKKRASATAVEAREEEGETARRAVRWDRALVYEGPKDDERPVPDASILKPAELDTWGNSTTATTSFGKAVPVVIRMRVFKDDEQ